jgi:hypothetical protein
LSYSSNSILSQDITFITKVNVASNSNVANAIESRH